MDNAAAHIAEILKREFALADEQLLPAAHLARDLDLDSLDAVVFSTQLEEATGVALSEQDWKTLKTLQDVIDIVCRRLNAGHSQTP